MSADQPKDKSLDVEQNSVSPNPDDVSVGSKQEPERGRFSSTCAYLMTAVGYAVGLGNLWRFPAIAYENGGGAFLIPYFCCTLTFGIPMLYLDMFTAQFVQAGSGKMFYKYMPVMQGIGWMQIFLTFQVNVYYLTIVGWSLMYLSDIFIGRNQKWTECGNEWNSPYCQSSTTNSSLCKGEGMLYFNDTCYTGNDSLVLAEKIRVPTEEYFENMILMRSTGFTDINIMNWKLLGAMIFLWLLCGAITWKGVKMLGKVAYVTTCVPYIIVGVSFVRGFFLPGMEKGLAYFLTPRFEAILDVKTWSAALHQVCLSLSLGYGGVQTMASFNRPNHNSYRDAIIIVFGDAIMSLMGGTAVFATLGYLSEMTGKPLETLATSGFSLTFITYPEAVSHMPLPWLWAQLFFLMMLLLGISTVIVDETAIATCCMDQFSWCGRHRGVTHVLVYLALFTGGLVCYTDAGIYFVTAMDDATGGIALAVSLILEVIVFAHIYGANELRRDIVEVLQPSRNFILRIIGKDGLMFWAAWKFWAPAICFVILLNSGAPVALSYGHGDREYKFPQFANVIAYIWGNSSFVILLIFFVVNLLAMQKEQGTWWAGFRVHPSHPSYKRVLESPTQEYWMDCQGWTDKIWALFGRDDGEAEENVSPANPSPIETSPLEGGKSTGTTLDETENH